MNKYLFKLYIAGQTARSEIAVSNLRKICEQHLANQYEIVVIDVLDQPSQAETERILATPTLVKYYPPPVRRIIGDLTDTQKVIQALGL